MKIMDVIVLPGKFITLRPIQGSDSQGLFEAGRFSQIWQWLTRGPFTSINDVAGWITEALADPNVAAFVIVDNKTQEIIGSTRYLNIEPENRALEIGYSWLTPKVWRTGVNREAKFLLLQYAFEALGYYRVQFKTDLRNLNSQRAIERLSAKKEGILRSSMLLPDGHRRDSVFYSILLEEWPAIKARLGSSVTTLYQV